MIIKIRNKNNNTTVLTTVSTLVIYMKIFNVYYEPLSVISKRGNVVLRDTSSIRLNIFNYLKVILMF